MAPTRSHRRRLAAIAAVCLLPACVAPPTEPTAPAFVLRDADGAEHVPFADSGVRAVALVFVVPDCPVANGYAPEVRRLCEEYEPRGVRFFLVQVDPDVTAADAARHAREFGYTCPVVPDSDHQLVRRAGVTKVPEVAVFTSNGERQYRGRIDDRYFAPGQRRSEPTSRDLRAALDAVLAGRPVPVPETDAVGCYIPPAATKGQP